MKVLTVSDSYHPTRDGVVVAVDVYTRALTAAGIETKIWAPAPKDEKDRREGVLYFKSITFWKYPEYYVPIFPSSNVEKMTKEDPDIVHLHGITVMSLKALIAAHQLKRPVVLTFHTMIGDTMKYYSPVKMPQDKAEYLVWKYLKYFTKWVDAVIVPSDSIAKEIVAKGLIPKDLRVIPTPIDTERFCPGEGREEIRERFHLNGKRVVACIGRLSFEKDIDKLVRAVSQMDEDIVLFMVGRGPAMDSLKELCQELNVTDRVIFAGFQSGDDLVKCYRAADVFATASRFETQCFVVLEAMACGLPVACANARALADYVVDGKNGFLFDDDLNECRKAIEKGLIADPEIRENAMLTAKEFSAERFTQHITELYNDLIQRKKG